MRPQTSDRQKQLEHLAGAVSLRGWNTVEVTLGADEFRIERHGARAACTVLLVPQELTFQAQFVFDNLSVHEFSFEIEPNDPNQTAPSGSMRFTRVDEAARWLLTCLETSGRSGGAG